MVTAAPATESTEEAKVKRQKGILRKLDDYLTPAPRFDPEDPVQIQGLKRLKRQQLKDSFENLHGLETENKRRESTAKLIEELLPEKGCTQEDI